MSAHFSSLQSTNSAQRGTSVESASSALGGLGSSTSGSDAQAFARWMSQHREAQQPALTSLGAMPDGVGGARANASSPVPSQRAMTATAAATSAQAAHRSLQSGHGAQHAPESPAQPQSGDKARQVAKQGQAKPASKPNTPAHEAHKAPGDGERDATGTDEGKDVPFKTAQGEAAAWVQELHPPTDVPASDPAAMLAWLASLTQADGANTALDGAQDTAASSGEGAVEESGAGRGGLPGLGGRGAHGGHSALLDAAEQVGKLDSLKDTLGLRGADASVQEDAGAVELSGKGSSSLEFSAMLARDVGRPTLNANATASDAPRHYTGSLSTPVDSPDFAQALADRVSMWISGPAASGPMTAELRLNPAEMGPVHIRIELDGSNAQVDFAAVQPETRQAIESSLSLLSGALEDAGLNLSGGGVSDQNAGQAWSGSQDEGRAPSWTSAATREGREVSEALVTPVVTRMPVPSGGMAGGLDLYA